MTYPFIGQITIFAGNFAPRAFAFCEGQLLAIASNTALFSILGTTYGGDGRTTFALPDLRGRVSMSPGTGPGLSSWKLGARGGVEEVTLNVLQIPSHTHFTSSTATSASITGSMKVTINTNTDTDSESADGTFLANNDSGQNYATAAGTTNLNAGAMVVNTAGLIANVTAGVSNSLTGGGLPHENRRPFLALNYIIALQGTYPSRS